MTKIGLALAAMLATSAQVMAQEATQSLQGDIVAMVEDFVGDPAHADAIETWLDMDRDGVEEALVSLPVDTDGLIEWHVFGGRHGRATDLLAWSSRTLEVIEQPRARDADGRPMDGSDLTLIIADGITFKRLPYSITPIEDFFSRNGIRQRPATAAELALLEELGYPNLSMESAQALTGDFLAHPGRERLFSLNAEYMMGEDGTYPYLLIGADDTVISEGRSAFHPWIYRDDRNGVQLVERSNDGLSLLLLEPAKDAGQ
ncbi:hypothetical protein [Paracoccus sp. ME4]|uniref:hypothetical protein n=1 Tax=Paracoccus sp. ME4 TaxID=3138066 RepID=UPI00398B3015